MRLIDADLLKDAIEKEKGDNDYMCRLCLESTKEIIDEQPTAFDVNLIVKKLEGEKTIAYDDSIDEKIRVRLWNKAIGNAIKIVEGGARTK